MSDIKAHSNEWSRLRDSVRDTITSHQLEAPIKLSALARALGIKVLASTLPAGISGEVRPSTTGSGFVIKINRHDSSRRQRFTVAHELAHFLLHHDEIGRGLSDDALYRSGLSDAREAEANRLAADILMPRSLLDEDRQALANLPIEEVVERLADKFEVSEAALRIRLGLT
jgi:Zn-dependent peptidase ImmA (M78 family)